MVTDVYSHILDEDRKRNAVLFEEAFSGKKNLNPQMVDTGAEKVITVPEGVDAETLIMLLLRQLLWKKSSGRNGGISACRKHFGTAG